MLKFKRKFRRLKVKKQLTASVCNIRRHEESCHLLLTERDTGFFYAAMKALVPRWDKCSNINSDCFEVRCVPSATDVQCVFRSQNKVLDISVFVTFTFLCLKYRNFKCKIALQNPVRPDIGDCIVL